MRMITVVVEVPSGEFNTMIKAPRRHCAHPIFAEKSSLSLRKTEDSTALFLFSLFIKYAKNSLLFT